MFLVISPAELNLIDSWISFFENSGPILTFNLTNPSSSIQNIHFSTHLCLQAYPMFDSQEPIPTFNILPYSKFNDYYSYIDYTDSISHNIRIRDDIPQNYWIHDSTFIDVYGHVGSALVFFYQIH